MASEPTDLIREADEHHQACCPDVTEDCECLGCGEEWPCEVRRLRDALEASEAEVHRLRTELSAWTTATLGLVRERDEARETADRFREGLGETKAALAEANATIAHLTGQLGEAWDDGNASGLDGWIGPGRGAGEVDDEAVRRRKRFIRRAIEGELS